MTTVPEKPFRVRIGENLVDVRPDPEAPGKFLLIINGKVHRADFRISVEASRTGKVMREAKQ